MSGGKGGQCTNLNVRQMHALHIADARDKTFQLYYLETAVQKV